MTFIEGIYKENFIEYASYVIKDRAIPHIDDGLKPVQRRILHSLFEMDDGKFHKVANVVGHSMKYHPHGDASIYSALVVLANKDLFIEKQGNFGNIFTGDSASAARYIECRVNKLAKKILYNPELTQYEDSYDSRNREPVTFPAKIPVVLANGTEGIAVGMSTKILPHNFIEILNAQIAYLKREEFELFPDFPTYGQVDVSEYDDGHGKVRVRAKLDIKDPKRVIIREIPFGTSTETLIASIEAATKKNKIKISTINDFTAESVEIELILARGVYSKDVVAPLFAFTDCELSISSNIVVIKDQKPCIMSVHEVLKHSTERLIDVLTRELAVEQERLKEKLHSKTLEQIFIENRIYKIIEELDTPSAIIQACMYDLNRFRERLARDITIEDIESLLKIPIRRISLYDIKKAFKEMKGIKDRLQEIGVNLKNIVGYGISFLEGLISEYSTNFPRRSQIVSFEKVSAREVATRDLKLKYDRSTGYLGVDVNGDLILEVSQYDRILVVQKNGLYCVINVPDKLFVDKGMPFCGFIDNKRVYNILYKDVNSGFTYIKRCRIEKFILNKEYSFVPEESVLISLTLNSDRQIYLKYKPKPRSRILEQIFDLSDYPVRGPKAKGIRLSQRELKYGRFTEKKAE